MNNLFATKCSVLINGKPCGFLVQVGELNMVPLSPLLFILASEGFSRGLKSLMALHIFALLKRAESKHPHTWGSHMIYLSFSLHQQGI